MAASKCRCPFMWYLPVHVLYARRLTVYSRPFALTKQILKISIACYCDGIASRAIMTATERIGKVRRALQPFGALVFGCMGSSGSTLLVLVQASGLSKRCLRGACRKSVVGRKARMPTRTCGQSEAHIYTDTHA